MGSCWRSGLGGGSRHRSGSSNKALVAAPPDSGRRPFRKRLLRTLLPVAAAGAAAATGPRASLLPPTTAAGAAEASRCPPRTLPTLLSIVIAGSTSSTSAAAGPHALHHFRTSSALRMVLRGDPGRRARTTRSNLPPVMTPVLAAAVEGCWDDFEGRAAATASTMGGGREWSSCVWVSRCLHQSVSIHSKGGGELAMEKSIRLCTILVHVESTDSVKQLRLGAHVAGHPRGWAPPLIFNSLT